MRRERLPEHCSGGWGRFELAQRGTISLSKRSEGEEREILKINKFRFKN
jgi:hypothetical protein